jgi:hypothetical protein
MRSKEARKERNKERFLASLGMTMSPQFRRAEKAAVQEPKRARHAALLREITKQEKITNGR